MKKKRRKFKFTQKEQIQAQERLDMILKVRSGQITVTEAAAQLGISRKTYYEWEEKGLQGMMNALTNKPAGRPASTVDTEKEQMKKKIKNLESELHLTTGILKVKEMMQEDLFNWEDIKKK